MDQQRGGESAAFSGVAAVGPLRVTRVQGPRCRLAGGVVGGVTHDNAYEPARYAM